MATSSGSISSNAGPLNVAELVGKLMEVENKSKAVPLARKAEGINAAISAVGNLKAALSTYQAALKGLNPASINTLKASINNAGSGSKPTADALSADINQDAQTRKLSQKLQSAGFPTGHVFAAGSVMAIKVGSTPPAFITLKADVTLAGLRDTINASKAGVSASIVNDASGARLVLESNAAGTASTIRVTAAGSLSSLVYPPSGSGSGMAQIQAPRDDVKAAAGNYAIAVSQLAQSHKLNSAGIAAGATFDDGILAIKSGNNSTALIRPTSNTLAGVRDAINASEAGVRASIINNGTHDRLILSAGESGAANAIRINGTGAFSIFSFNPDDPASASGGTTEGGMVQAVKAQDARITIDGIAVASASNNIKNVLSGVQINVTRLTGPDDKLMLNIASDTDGMTSIANSIVTSYNALLKTVADLTRFTPGTKRGERGASAPLANDAAVRNMMAQLRGVLMAPVEGDANLTHLARIGISFQKNGTLELDNARFTDVAKKSFDAVGHLLGSKQGVVPRLQKIMEHLLGNEGIVEKKKEGLQASLKITEGRYEDASRRLAEVRDRTTIRFNRLNVALAQSEQRGAYLLKQLEALTRSR